MLELKKAGIASRPGTHAVHVQDYFRRKYGISEWSAPFAYCAMNQSIALPLHPMLTDSEIAYVISVLREICGSIVGERSNRIVLAGKR